MPPERFDELVALALDEIPPELTAVMDNVVVLVEDEPPPDDPRLLGLYEGIPITERDWSYGGSLPDRITVFRGPTLRMCHTEAEVVDEVHITVVHEVAHHFGIDDDRLHDLGYQYPPRHSFAQKRGGRLRNRGRHRRLAGARATPGRRFRRAWWTPTFEARAQRTVSTKLQPASGSITYTYSNARGGALVPISTMTLRAEDTSA